jgi:hypothetical protein
MAQKDEFNVNIEGDEEIDLEEFEKFNVSKHINNVSTINWLRSRAADKAKIQYLNNTSELEQHQAIVKVFEKFDDDGNGTLEVKELRDMFEYNNIDISSQELLTLFSLVDEDESGALDINEFKEFALSEEANKHFRQIINELRYKEIYKHIEKRAKFLPFNFSTLLNFLSDEARKDNLRRQIEGVEDKEHMAIKAKNKVFSVSEVKQDLRRFMQLFKLAYNKVRFILISNFEIFETYFYQYLKF